MQHHSDIPLFALPAGYSLMANLLLLGIIQSKNSRITASVKVFAELLPIAHHHIYMYLYQISCLDTLTVNL